MSRAIFETERRRKKQSEHNEANGIVPKTIIKEIRAPLEISIKGEGEKKLTRDEKKALIERLEKEMKRAAKELDFETAAAMRDKIRSLMGV